MAEDKDKGIEVQEFQLDPDAELRFEIENKNETVTLEVSYFCLRFSCVSGVVVFVFFFNYTYISPHTFQIVTKSAEICLV